MSNPLEELSFLPLFNALTDAILLVDNAGKIVLANTSTKKMLAYTDDEMIGLSIEQLIPETYREQHVHYRMQYSKKPEKRPMGKGKNLVALTRAAQLLPVDISLSPVDVAGKHYILVTLHAADKQIAVEASLKTSEERFRLAKLSAGLGVFDIDLTHYTVRFDALISQMFGFKANEDIPYDAFLKAIDITDQLRWTSMFEQATHAGEDNEYQLAFGVNHALTQHWLHVAGKVFFHDGTAVRMLGVAQDVTEHKLLQQKLSKQRIELETLSNIQVAIQTASAIAHEINQPLAAISAYSEVALYALKAENLDEERLSRSLLGCVEQAHRAGNSLHELMEFLHKGKVALLPISLNEVVREAIEIVKHYDYGGFHPSLHLESALPKVLANRTQLQKVLVNLLRNGVEAVHNAGVPIANIHVKVRTHVSLQMVELIIQDNGPGLSQEAAKHIFEPFFTTKSNGVGMGLAISRSLIEACGGELWFDANSQDGAIFHLTLPFASQS